MRAKGDNAPTFKSGGEGGGSPSTLLHIFIVVFMLEISFLHAGDYSPIVRIL